MPTVTAHFASRRSDLVVVERPAEIEHASGRVLTKPGKYHHFEDGHLRVEGQKSIDFLRERCRAQDGPEMWEIDASDVPGITELLAELATADLSRVREVYKAESEGPNRAPVLSTCRAIFEKMGAAERGPGAQERRTRHSVPGDGA